LGIDYSEYAGLTKETQQFEKRQNHLVGFHAFTLTYLTLITIKVR